jgi:hypothetical protein
VARDDGGAGSSRRACCLISELLEETGLDRQKIRELRRQVLEGIILLCQWQLERMEREPRPGRAGKARKVDLS